MQSCTNVHASLDRRVLPDRHCKTPSLTGTRRGDTQVGLARLGRFNMLNSAKAELVRSMVGGDAVRFATDFRKCRGYLKSFPRETGHQTILPLLETRGDVRGFME